MKLAVVTITIGDRFKAMSTLTHPTLKRYAEKVGAEFVVLDQPGDYPHWEKMRLYDLLVKYNRIIFLDTDIIVRDDCPNLFEMIPESKLGIFNEGRFASRLGSLQEAYKEYDQPFPEKYDGTYYNTGVMVLSRRHRPLFKRPSKIVELGMYEQGYLNMKIRQDLDNDPKREERVEELDYKFNRMTIIDDYCGIHRLDSYIVHYAGAPQQVDILRIMKMDLENWEQKKPDYQYDREIVMYAGGGMGDQLGSEPVMRFAMEKMFKDVKTNFTIVTNWPRFFAHLNVPCMTREVYEANPKFDTPVKILKSIPAPEESVLWQVWSHISGHTLDYAAVNMLHRTLPDDYREIKMPASLEGLVEVMDIIGDMPTGMVLVHPGRGWTSKTFPASWWNEVISLLQQAGKRVGVIGQHISDDQGYVDVDIPEGVIDFRNLLSLDGLIALIASSEIVISNDSAPVHIAGAFDTKILLIATCRHPDYILPYRKGSKNYNAFAFARKLTIDEWDLSPTRIFKESADVIKGDILDYIPIPLEVVTKAISMCSLAQEEKGIVDVLEETSVVKSETPVQWEPKYEPEIQAYFKSFLKKGDGVIDVGANHGIYTVLASSLVGSEGNVHAFEPEKVNFARLRDNVNGNVTLTQAAVGAENGKADLYFNLDNDGGHALWNPALHPLNPITKKHKPIIETVDMVTLDSTINFAPVLIKTDTEGYELWVLKGAQRLLLEHQPHVISEVNLKGMEALGTSPKELQDYMESLGYAAFSLHDGSRIEDIHPKDEYVYSVLFKVE